MAANGLLGIVYLAMGLGRQCFPIRRLCREKGIRNLDVLLVVRMTKMVPFSVLLEYEASHTEARLCKFFIGGSICLSV